MPLTDFFDFWVASPEFFFWFSLALIFMFVTHDCNSLFFGYPILNEGLSLISLFVILCTLVLTWTSHSTFFYIYNLFMLHDELSFLAKIIILVISAIWILFTFKYNKMEKIHNFEFWILIMIGVGDMFFLVSTVDIICLYLVLEIQALIFYALTAFKKSSEFSTEAALKYFLLGSLSSVILLFSLSLIYGLTGLTSYVEIGSFFHVCIWDGNLTTDGFKLSILLLIIAFMFKLGVAPFHIWLPDVYEGAPSSITAFFATVYKFVICVVVFRTVIFWLFPVFDFVQQNFLLFIHFSLIIGSCGAFLQTKWKRFLAYSSIFHTGFLLLALTGGTLQSLESFFFYLIIYILTNVGFFSVFFCLVNCKRNIIIRYLSDLKMLFKTNQTLACSFIILLFSTSGIPPIAGFLAKFYVLFSVLSNNFFILVLFCILFSCFSCFYYLRIIKTVCFEIVDRWSFYDKIDRSISILLAFITLSLIFLFINLNSFILPFRLIILSVTF